MTKEKWRERKKKKAAPYENPDCLTRRRQEIPIPGTLYLCSSQWDKTVTYSTALLRLAYISMAYTIMVRQCNEITFMPQNIYLRSIVTKKLETASTPLHTLPHLGQHAYS